MRVALACGRARLELDLPDVPPATVAQALALARARRPELAAGWADEEGRLRESLAVFVNGEHVRYREGLATVLGEGDSIYVIPLITGG